LNWLNHPLFERKDGKKDQLLNLDDHATTKKNKQYKEIEEMSVKLQEHVAGNRELLLGTDAPGPAWDNYLKYIDGIVLDGLVKTVAVS
jgi:dynein heavy chain